MAKFLLSLGVCFCLAGESAAHICSDTAYLVFRL